MWKLVYSLLLVWIATLCRTFSQPATLARRRVCPACHAGGQACRTKGRLWLWTHIPSGVGEAEVLHQELRQHYPLALLEGPSSRLASLGLLQPG
jgi:hypothetical protein